MSIDPDNNPELPSSEEPQGEPAIPEKYRDRLAEMEKLLKQVDEDQKLYRQTSQNSALEQVHSHPTGKPYKNDDMEEVMAQTSKSYSAASYWISIVTVGVCIMVLPGAAGYFIDQNFNINIFGPIGILLGMVAGIIYLIRTSDKTGSSSR